MIKIRCIYGDIYKNPSNYFNHLLVVCYISPFLWKAVWRILIQIYWWIQTPLASIGGATL